MGVKKNGRATQEEVSAGHGAPSSCALTKAQF